MRRHAKAPTAGSTKRQAVGLGHSMVFAAISALALLLPGAPAGAAVVTERPLLFTFNGSDSTLGPLKKPFKIAVDYPTGNVYVSEGELSPTVISKFNANGNAVNFSATGTSSLTGAFGGLFTNRVGVAVDNSGGPNQGRLLASQFGNTRVLAFAPSGSPLWSFVPTGGQPEDVAMDKTGHPWTSLGHQYATTGSPPAQIFSLGASGSAIDVDANGNVYLGPGTIRKYVGGVFNSNLDTNARDVHADQSSPSGHIFTVHDGNFFEFDSTGALVRISGNGVIDSGTAIAYNPSADRVYVADEGRHEIAVFGTEVTGTVPDPTIEATTNIGIGKAEFHGTINPQSVPNGYYFEWKLGTSSAWQNVSRSPLQTLPEDSSSHAVSFTATDLRGNQTYQVRLVAANTQNGLHSASSFNQFNTLKAAASPTVTIAAPSAIGSTSAHIAGTVNPKEDSFFWEVQKSTDPTCSTGFASEQQAFVPGGGINTPLPVEFDLQGLLPSQQYCVRIRAVNSFGATLSEVKQFTTQAVAPKQLFTAFAAPRTATSARLNGRVNPEGAPFTYRFEYSEDGGANWIALPDREDTREAREQVVIGEELTGLQPDTTYQYRFSAETAGGPASPQGEVKEFTTRTSAEMEPPARGYELVNRPNKGNQNVRADVLLGTSPMTEDGEKAIWNVLAGIAGGNTGSGSTFLAERTPTGWRSQSLIPPAKEQSGLGESGGYSLDATTPDFSSFLFNSGVNALERGRKLVRINTHQNETLLQEYPQQVNGDLLDLTDDGAHVLLVNQAAAPQLEDVGNGSPELISVMPDGLPSQCGLKPDGNDTGKGFVGLQWLPGYHMISTTDASRVYFESPPNGSDCSTAPYALYVRNREAETTTLIDGGEGEPHFIRATPDGRTAYFISPNQLEPADANADIDIYRWDEAVGGSTCITCHLSEFHVTLGSSPGVLMSNDFSHIYLQSTRQLIPGQGRAGDINVYVLSEGELRYITSVGRGANADLGSTIFDSAKISSDGNVLLFMSGYAATNITPLVALTSDQLAPSCTNPDGSTGPCAELFRYDDTDGSLECISCRQGGVTQQTAGGAGASFGGSQYEISADGSTAAFITHERLLSEDVNNGADVYEWRNGVTRLVTDGVTSFQSGIAAPEMMSVSRHGRDIFFAVADPGMTGFEEDGLKNLYDARFGGGFEVPVPPPPCAGDSCQGPLEAPPGLESSASAGFSGKGNLAPERDCSTSLRQARRLNRAAVQLRRRARRAASARQAKQLRKRATRLADNARRLGRDSRRCRRVNRGAAR